ncbi:hypothetical protein BGZ65_010499, partial [Modicella reniformis]
GSSNVSSFKVIREGQSTHQVAKRLDICHNSVRRTLMRNKENVPKKPGGRPRKLDENMINHLKLNLKRGVFKSAVEANKGSKQDTNNAYFHLNC